MFDYLFSEPVHNLDEHFVASNVSVLQCFYSIHSYHKKHAFCVLSTEENQMR